MKTIKNRIIELLETNTSARDDDRLLFALYINKYLNEFVVDIQGTKHIALRDILRLPSFESIRRCRQKIQEEGKFPCSEKASKKRFEHTEKIRVELLNKKESLFY